MKRTALLVFLAGLNLVGFGCVSNLDTALMDMRADAAANEKLYAAACLKFVDVADQMASFKHTLQRQIITEREENWALQHTRDGIVSASVEEFADMLAKRDAAAGQMALSQSVWSQTTGDFRRMIADKQAFAATIYAQEVDAQKAKESLAAAANSVLQALIGASSAAAIALPMLVP